MQHRLLGLTCAALGLAALGGCGGDGGSSGSTKDLTIYSSLPLQGASRPQVVQFVDGIKLALEQHGPAVGDRKITFKSLDDSTAQAGTWTPESTSANARRAASDDSSIAYLGEFNSGATALSLPILNRVGIPQVATVTAVGLTRSGPGTENGEPEKYYPTKKRTLIRVVPMDSIQGNALATLMKADGCTAVAVVNDQELYGIGIAGNLKDAAGRVGLSVVEDAQIDPKAANFRSVAAGLKSKGTDCFAFAGVTANGGVQLFKDVGAALPDAKLYGPDGVAEPGFAEALPGSIAARTKVTVATLSPEEYPPEGRKFFETFTAKYGVDEVAPYTIYGYEMTQLTLDAIDAAVKEDADADVKTLRAAVLAKIFATKDRPSVLGSYGIDANGDTTLTDFGVYAIVGGKLEFEQKIEAQGT